MPTEVQPAPRWINGIEPAPALRAMNGTQILEYECREQPQRLLDLLTAYKSDDAIKSQLATFKKLAAAKAGGETQPILLIGMGGSYASAISATTHLQSHGRPAFTIDAGEWLNYAQPIWHTPLLNILLTTSGESAELVELLKQNKSPLGLICNNSASTGWQLAQHKLPILAGPEYGNATKTYANSTAAAIILASEIANTPWQSEFTQTLDVITASLDKIFAARADLEAFTAGSTNIELIARGSAFGAAIMGALTIREMSGFRAAPHTGAAFRHGPNLDTDPSHTALIFALGRTANLGHKLAAECNRKGGKVLLVSSDPSIQRTEKLLPIHLPPVPEPWEVLTAILIPQALTLAMIEKNGCKLPPRFAYAIMEQ